MFFDETKTYQTLPFYLMLTIYSVATFAIAVTIAHHNEIVDVFLRRNFDFLFQNIKNPAVWWGETVVNTLWINGAFFVGYLLEEAGEKPKRLIAISDWARKSKLLRVIVFPVACALATPFCPPVLIFGEMVRIILEEGIF